MGLPLIGGLLSGAKALARSGVIRGSLGKVLGGAGRAVTTMPGGAVIRQLPVLGAGGAAVGGAIRATPSIAGRIARGAGGAAVAGAAFEVGGRLLRADGTPRKAGRSMNYGNGKALKRAIRRFDGAAKMYSKVLSAQKGTRCGGYTIKPKRGKAKCR